MCALRLPEKAVRVIEGEWPRGYGDSKWLIYSIDSAPREANELYCTIRAADGRGSEWDEDFAWLKPATQYFDAPDIQHILDHHFRMLEHLFTHLRDFSETGWTPYPYGFIVITEEGWRERGVTAVHCDKDRGKWKVTRCGHIPVAELDILESVIELDESFDTVRDTFDGSGNDGPDNQGGSVPVGEWQFAVYSTGPSEIGTRKLQRNVSHKLPDPRGYDSYLPGETSLHLLDQILPDESVSEDWPPTYAKFMNEPIVNATRQPKICKLHPSLLVHVRGDHSGDISDIEILQMEWDHNVTQSEEALKRLGRESKTTVQKCEAEVLVATLQQLARGM